MKATRTLIACVFLLCLHYVVGGHDLSEEYQFSAVLDRDGAYTLHWNFDLQAQTIAFAVNVSTTGWVGFGLSPNGGMIGSDVVIGWVDDNGNVEFHDRYAEGEFLPPIDESQDWLLVSGEEENGYTILEFTRNLTSCDERDMNVEADTARVIWSYHTGPDPQSNSDILRHENRGTVSLNLLGGLPVERHEENSDSFIIRNENLTIPGDKDTTYWCSVYRLPPEVREQQRYVYKFGPVISQGNIRYVHHILVYLCEVLDHTHAGASTECDNADINIGICRGSGAIIAVWAVGGTEFVYPEGVAFPVGGEGKAQYVIIEMHYDNPDLDVGVLDSSGIEFTYTSTPPRYNAGALAVSHTVSNQHIIPPGAENFITTALCSSECTQEFFPPEGITVFGNFLHTHLAGHGLVLRHFRENEECGVLEELQPIEENRKYDFNFQQVNHLPKEIKILPGDTIQLECFYRTRGYNSVTLGGESTREEMCVSFLYYYPEVDLNYCFSAPQFPGAYMDLAQQHLNSSQQTQFFNSLQTQDGEMASSVLNQIEWTQGAVNSFQQSLDTSNVQSLCFSRSNFSKIIQVAKPLPTVECPYEAPNTCTGTQPQECCQRVQAPSGATRPTVMSYHVGALLLFIWAAIFIKF